MSKWNKPNKEISEEFLQNQERRKQMIVQAIRRRKQKEKIQQQQNEANRKINQQALAKHKQSKRQAYNKYLRPNSRQKNATNSNKINHSAKKQQKDVTETAKKWKDNNGSYNDIKRKVEKDKGSSNKGNERRQQLQSEFMNEWKEEEQQEQEQEEEVTELIESKLTDSLQEQSWQKIAIRHKNNNNKQEQEIQNIKQLIGYDSILMSIEQKQFQTNHINELIQCNQQKKDKNNEGQIFRQLKNDQNGKILNWAHQQSDQADDLFSNCSSKKAYKTLKQINKQIKDRKTSLKMQNGKLAKNNKIQLQPIKQAKQDKYPNLRSQSVRKIKIRQNSSNKNNSRNKNQNDHIGGRNQEKQTRTNHQYKNKSKEHGNSQRKLRNLSQEAKQKKEQKINNRKKQTQYKPPAPATKKKEFGTDNHFHQVPNDNNTVATQDQRFEVQSFIKNQLIGLNEEENKLQREIMRLHHQNKGEIKQVEQKYNIKNNYQNTRELINAKNETTNLDIRNRSVTEQNIEQSIVRLNDMLLRKQMQKKQTVLKPSLPSQQSQLSSINPFCTPAQLHQHVLDLAQNISKFEKPIQKQQQGYCYTNNKKMKKNYHIKEIICKQQQQSNNDINTKFKIQSIQKNQKQIRKPPILEYSLTNELEDKIQINEKYRNLLFE